nr:hypothetical protein BaRGS_031634 [Batillaria attramentaria]
MKNYKIGVLGLSETRWLQTGQLRFSSGEQLLYSGHTEDGAPHTEAQRALIGWEPVNSRIITAKFITKKKDIKLNIIQCYAPTNDAEEEKKDDFYQQLQTVIDRGGTKDMTILMGDFNAKIGSDNTGYEDTMGTHGLGQMNENGERFANFCPEPAKSFEVKTGVRQGCLLSPFLFLLVIDWIMKTTTAGRKNGIQWTLWTQLDDLDFANDLALLSHSHSQMQDKTTRLEATSAGTGLKINRKKTELMKINTTANTPVTVGGEPIREVESFVYLGSVVDGQGGTDRDVTARIGKARAAMVMLKNVWASKVVSIRTKLRIFNSNVKSVLLYGCETWRTTKTVQQKIQTFLNTCLRRIFNIRWPEKIRNEELWERPGQEPVAKQILRRKWGWIGHTLRKPASSTTCQALTWNPQGKKKRGRPRNSWRRDTEAELWCQPVIKKQLDDILIWCQEFRQRTADSRDIVLFDILCGDLNFDNMSPGFAEIAMAMYKVFLLVESEVFVKGQMVHEKRDMDSNCRHVKTTATMPDGSSSTSDEDFDRGVELIQVSNDTNVCYVRFITEQEKQEVSTCQNGVVTRNADEPEEEEEELEAGPELSATLLSPKQQEQCQGKNIVSLVPGGHESASREKRDTDGCRPGYLRIRYWSCNLVTRQCVLARIVYLPVRICPKQ